MNSAAIHGSGQPIDLRNYTLYRTCLVGRRDTTRGPLGGWRDYKVHPEWVGTPRVIEDGRTVAANFSSLS
jgi:hypothetical protein